jgi:hypothetical protein
MDTAVTKQPELPREIELATQALSDLGVVIENIEKKISVVMHAEIASAPDPQAVREIRDRIQAHSTRLSSILSGLEI